MGFDMVAPPDFDAAIAGANRAATEISITVDIPKIRLESLKEAALGYGARSGLARRSYEIVKILYENQELLDGVFNFNSLLLDRSVMPPVLSEAQNALKQPDSDTIRVADAVYRIERQAAFVTAPPNWRDYLVREYRYKVDLPANLLLPKLRVFCLGFLAIRQHLNGLIENNRLLQPGKGARCFCFCTRPANDGQTPLDLFSNGDDRDRPVIYPNTRQVCNDLLMPTLQ